MTSIHDMIQTCDLLPGEDTTRRLLDICSELNNDIDRLALRISELERQLDAARTDQSEP